MGLVDKLIFYITSFFLSIAPTTTYVEGVVGQPRSFIPGQTVTQADKAISNLIYRGLFKYDAVGSLAPDLADTWSIEEDGLVYTIKLKEDQFWVDGTRISADDLLYTAYITPDLNDVATDKVDDLTVRYTLPNKFSPFLSLLTVGVMQANTVESQDSLKPVSNGDFRVLRVEKSGPIIKRVVLYNTGESGEIKKLAFRYYVNEDELVTGARLGEIDAFTANSNYEIKNFVGYRYPMRGVYYALYFNLRQEKFDDLELRNKMRQVLNIQELTEGRGVLVEGPVSRSVFTNREMDFEYYEEDFRENLGVSFELTVPDTENQVALAEGIAEVWSDSLGMQVSIVKVDPDEFADEVIRNRDFEVLLYGQETGRDPDRYVNWHSAQSDYPGLNLSGFSHVRVDRALEEGRNEVENDQRVVHYNEFQRALEENTPAIFLYHPYVNYYVSEYISGVGEKYTFSAHDRFLDFSNWKRVKTF
jgi:ABC-type transport system substrate-binding protein